jgi:hypothetical protein
LGEEERKEEKIPETSSDNLFLLLCRGAPRLKTTGLAMNLERQVLDGGCVVLSFKKPTTVTVWQRVARSLLETDATHSWLNQNQKAFVRNMSSWSREPSEKQIKWLVALIVQQESVA